MENKYRFHLLSLSHLPQSRTYASCAFTQKNRKLAKMLTGMGHEVFFYGSEGSDVEEYCNSDKLHFVQTHTLADICDSWGNGDNRFEIGYNWLETDYRHDFNEMDTKATKKFYLNASAHINSIKRPDDFLLCTQGFFHKAIVDRVEFSHHLVIESGIGYRGSNQGWNRVFESQHIESFSYGSENPFGSSNGKFYDRIIGNYFALEDVEFSDKKDDYFLFCARLIRRKGILEAYHACKETGRKLLIVGQGGRILPDGSLTCQYPGEFTIPNDGTWEYLGFKGIDERKRLMAKAQGFFSFTEYLEIFGGSHVEAMLSGTPVITSNFGVYAGNTFVDGVHGFRCNTLDDLAFAVNNCHKLDPLVIRKNAERYLMDNVKWEYQRLFDDLYAVYESSVDEKKKGWSRVNKKPLEWRKRTYPHLFE